MYNDLYCKVFVDTDMDYEKLFALLINFINGKKEAVNYIITEWCDIKSIFWYGIVQSSEIRIPVAKSNSITAISRSVVFFL